MYDYNTTATRDSPDTFIVCSRIRYYNQDQLDKFVVISTIL